MQFRIPVFVSFVPLIIVSVVIGAVTVSIFATVHDDAVQTAMETAIKDKLRFVEEKIVGPMRKQQADAWALREQIKAKDSYCHQPARKAFNGTWIYPTEWDDTYLKPATMDLMIAWVMAGGTYSYVYQSIRKAKPYAHADPNTTNPDDFPWGDCLCGKTAYCDWSTDMSYSPVIYFNWTDRRDEPQINWTIAGNAPYDSTGFPYNINQRTLTNSSDHLEGRWAHEVWRDIADANTLTATLTYTVPLSFDVNGHSTSTIGIDMDASWVISFLHNINIPATETTILFPDTHEVLATTYASLASTFRYRNPEDNTTYTFYNASTAPEPMLQRAVSDLIAHLGIPLNDFPDGHTLANARGSNVVISAQPIRQAKLNLMILMVTQKDYYFADGEHARNEAIGISAALIVVTVICTILNAIFLTRPLKVLGVRMIRTAALQGVEEDEEHQDRSIFKEVAELQDTTSRMGRMLSELKTFVPHNVLQGFAGDKSSAEYSDDSNGQSVNALGSQASHSAITFNNPLVMSNVSDEQAQGYSEHEKVDANRIGSKLNQFRPINATMLVVSLIRRTDGTRTTTSSVDAYSYDCEMFMNSTIPHVLKGRGAIEQQRPDHLVATFERGVHSERATRCALRIDKSLKRHGLLGVCVLHAGTFLSGSCGSKGRNAFVVANEFFACGPNIAHLSDVCLHSSVLATDAVVRCLPPSILTVPTDAVTGLGEWASSSSSATLYEVCRSSPDMQSAVVAAKEVFSAILKGNFKEGTVLCSRNAKQHPCLVLHFERLEKLCVHLTRANGDGSEKMKSYVRRYVGWSLDSQGGMPDAGSDKRSFPISVTGAASLTTNTTHHSVEIGGDSSDDSDVDEQAHLRDAMIAKKQSAFSDVQHEESSNSDSGALFQMCLPDGDGVDPTITDTAGYGGITASQNAAFNEQKRHAMDTNIPLRFVDIRSNTWLRAPDAPPLGKGSFATVHLGMNAQGDIVALKCMDIEAGGLSDIGPESLLETEVGVLTSIHHPNIASFISLAIRGSHVILILEYVAGGTLKSVINAYKMLLPRGAAKRFAVDILRGLEHLHAHNVVHGDIKPANVLIGGDSVCKLTDFGSAVKQRRQRLMQSTSERFEKSDPSFNGNDPSSENGGGGGSDEQPRLVGSPAYMAPEAARGEVPTTASDVWSFGILLHELVMGNLPWAHESKAGGALSNVNVMLAGLAKPAGSEGAVRPRIFGTSTEDDDDDSTSNGSYVNTDSIDKRLAISVISACLTEDPKTRPTVAQLAAFEYFM